MEYPSVGRDGSPLELLLSPKDTDAPGLSAAREQGLLPTWEACREFIATSGQVGAAGGLHAHTARHRSHHHLSSRG